MVQAMMRSEDFRRNHLIQCKENEIQSAEVALKMSYEFNRNRLYMALLFKRSKIVFEEKLSKLHNQIKLWNKMFSKQRIHGKYIKKQFTTKQIVKNKKIRKDVNNEIEEIDETEEKSLKTIDFLIKFMNPYLFQDFISKLAVVSSILPDKKKMLEKTENFLLSKKKFYDSEEDSDFSSSVSSIEEKIENKQTNLVSLDSMKKEIEGNIEYDFKLQNCPELATYLVISNIEAIVYFLFFFNHFVYASLESLVFPLSILGYAMLEYPRPPMKFFRAMLIYTEIVFFIKFNFQLKIVSNLLNLKEFRDPWNLGFNLAENTYSETIFNYLLWDMIIMFGLLCREYYYLKIGMWHQNETDIENLEQAKIRLLGQSPYSYFIDKTKHSGFFDRLLPRDKGEKPGIDLYLFIFVCQLVILCYIFIFFSRIDGNNLNISQSLKTNQFQGDMVIAIFIIAGLILFERYLYLRHISKAVSDAAEELKAEREAFLNKKPFIILPESNFKRFWNIIIILLLIYTASFVPVKTAFFDDDPHGLAEFEQVLDALFMLDLIIQFFSAYQDPSTGFIEVRPKMIAKNYISSWFLIDATACIPF